MLDAAPEPQQTKINPASRRLAPGTELLGQYEGSAFAEPPYLLRRGDGQVIQLTRLLYLVATALTTDDRAAMAARVSAGFGRPVSVDNIDYLIAHKLIPLGVVAGESHSHQRSASSEPLVRAAPLLLGLRFRTRVVPERFHQGISTALRPMFWAPLVAAALTAFAGFDGWLVTQTATIVVGVDDAIAHPDQLLVIIAVSVGVGFFHEIGHATAARYGGAKPGVMGVGIYLMLPVFYTDVTDSYRLSRRGRLRTDLGGLYFNVLAILVAAAVYAATHFALLLVFVALSQLEMLYQFLPFVRMDGYYVVSDLIGVPNLFAYVGPTISRLVRRRDPAGRTRLGRLTPKARGAISAWVALTVPILGLNFVVLALLAPRIFPTGWASARTQAEGLAGAAGRGDVVGAANHFVGLVLVAVPATGMVFLAVSLIRRLGPLAARAARLVARLLQRLPVRPVSVATVALVALIVISAAYLAEQSLHYPSPTAAPIPAPLPARPRPPAPLPARPRPPVPVPARPRPPVPVPARPRPPVPLPARPRPPVPLPARPRPPVPLPARPQPPVPSPPPRTVAAAAENRLASSPDSHGNLTVTHAGNVVTGAAPHLYGSEAGPELIPPVLAIASTPVGPGYRLASRNRALTDSYVAKAERFPIGVQSVAGPTRGAPDRPRRLVQASTAGAGADGVTGGERFVIPASERGSAPTRGLTDRHRGLVHADTARAGAERGVTEAGRPAVGGGPPVAAPTRVGADGHRLVQARVGRPGAEWGGVTDADRPAVGGPVTAITESPGPAGGSRLVNANGALIFAPSPGPGG